MKQLPQNKTNTDYYKEVSINNQPSAILKDRVCPKCNSKLGAIHPERVWCINEKCNYSELHIVGKGTRELVFE